MNTQTVTGVTVPFSDKICMSIMVNAVEGGYSPWLFEMTKLKIVRDDELNITEIQVGKPKRDTEYDEPAVRHVIKPQDIRDAMQWLINNQGKDGACHPSYVADILKECDEEFGCGADAYACDIVLQVAVLGKVIYG